MYWRWTLRRNRPAFVWASPSAEPRHIALPRVLLPGARFPIWEAQEQFLARIKGYTDRWQPDGIGRVYLDATMVVAPDQPARIEGDTLKWCQAVAAGVRSLGLAAFIGRHKQQVWRSGAGGAGRPAKFSIAARTRWRKRLSFLAGQPVAGLALPRHRRLACRSPLFRNSHIGAIYPPAGHWRVSAVWSLPVARRNAGHKAWTTGRSFRPGKAPRSRRGSNSRRPRWTVSACWL